MGSSQETNILGSSSFSLSTFARIHLSYDEDPYFLVPQISNRSLRSSRRFLSLRAFRKYLSRYNVNPSWTDTVQLATEPLCWAMGRPGFYTIKFAPTKRPTVLALSATTWEQVAVSPKTATGCCRIRFLQAEEGYYCTFSF